MHSNWWLYFEQEHTHGLDPFRQQNVSWIMTAPTLNNRTDLDPSCIGSHSLNEDPQ